VIVSNIQEYSLAIFVLYGIISVAVNNVLVGVPMKILSWLMSFVDAWIDRHAPIGVEIEGVGFVVQTQVKS
jgi:hypothetical protein